MTTRYGIKEPRAIISAQVSRQTQQELLRRARERDTSISEEIRSCISESLERDRWGRRKDRA